MRHNKIYLIKTLSVKNGVDLTDDVQELIFKKMASVLDKGDDKEIAIELFDDKEFMFFRLSYMKVMRICSILDPYLNYLIEEVTDEVINGNNEYKILINSNDLTDFFNTFRIENTTVDDILDKILDKGINSLDDIDKLILTK